MLPVTVLSIGGAAIIHWLRGVSAAHRVSENTQRARQRVERQVGFVTVNLDRLARPRRGISVEPAKRHHSRESATRSKTPLKLAASWRLPTIAIMTTIMAPVGVVDVRCQ